MYRAIAVLVVIAIYGIVSGFAISQGDLPPGAFPTPYRTPTCDEYHTPFCPPPPTESYDCNQPYPPPPCFTPSNEPVRSKESFEQVRQRDMAGLILRIKAIFNSDPPPVIPEVYEWGAE